MQIPHTSVSDLGSCSKVLFDLSSHKTSLLPHPLVPCCSNPTNGFFVPQYQWLLFYIRSAVNFKKNIIVPNHTFPRSTEEEDSSLYRLSFVSTEKRSCLCPLRPRDRLAFSLLYSWRSFLEDSNAACSFRGWQSCLSLWPWTCIWVWMLAEVTPETGPLLGSEARCPLLWLGKQHTWCYSSRSACVHVLRQQESPMCFSSHHVPEDRHHLRRSHS